MWIEMVFGDWYGFVFYVNRWLVLVKLCVFFVYVCWYGLLLGVVLLVGYVWYVISFMVLGV